ncbi:SpaA isopeptide-forming pilin-related protein [Pseudoflavonifractor phocaeensis]|uniref:SpaA isopeptide-forming pilin-related protein n=1 Tax=Pseudoflavonifractor phocaeensis TaxID=1870988 RepID=UPI003B9684BD
MEATIVVAETKTIEGYTIHEETRTQTVVVNPNDTQELTFYNDPVGGVEIIKVDEADKTVRLADASFEIRKMDDALVDTVTTDQYGRVFLSLEDGAYGGHRNL